MVLAALASFAVLLVAWIVAPDERRRRDGGEAAGQPLAPAPAPQA